MMTTINPTVIRMPKWITVKDTKGSEVVLKIDDISVITRLAYKERCMYKMMSSIEVEGRSIDIEIEKEEYEKIKRLLKSDFVYYQC